LPLPDASFDTVLSTHVAEHLAHPEAAFGEMARVLRPGGRLLLLTPNRLHYVPLLARFLPQRLHVAVNRRRGLVEQDVSPTLYRANTAADLRRLASGAGLRLERLEAFETEPEYLAFHPLAYALGVLYERLVNRHRVLAPLRVNLLLVARRPA
jgi:SAM-dependent methyltransferase